MGQTCQDDTRTELSRPGEPGLTTRMVEKGIQQQQQETVENIINLFFPVIFLFIPVIFLFFVVIVMQFVVGVFFMFLVSLCVGL